MSVDTIDSTYVVNNKLVETNENLKNITFTIDWELRDSWLSGKYLAKVVIQDPITKVMMTKDYFCSITRKEKKVNYVFLNHLEEKEILKWLWIDASLIIETCEEITESTIS